MERFRVIKGWKMVVVVSLLFLCTPPTTRAFPTPLLPREPVGVADGIPACRGVAPREEHHEPSSRRSALSVRRHTAGTLGRGADAGVEDGPPTRGIPDEIRALVASLGAVQALPRIRDRASAEDYANVLAAVDLHTKPTFRRLFTHDTWKRHIGGSTLQRWTRCMATTPSSVILRAVAHSVLGLSAWAALASIAASRLVPTHHASLMHEQALPLSLCGNAIGLLLVFRTNQAYKRLEEARELMEQVVHLSGDMVSTLVSAWQPSSSGDEPSVRTSTVASVGRHLAAFAWSLRDELRDGDTREDVLRLLLSLMEASWVTRQRSRALAIHGHMRWILFQETQEGRLPECLHLVLEDKLSKLASVAASCERLFTSPIPPTMSRHGLRSLTLWMVALPTVLAFSVPLVVNVAWTAVISFVYLGIDELGVQVEQPFRVIPMWQLCQLVQEDILEFTLHPLDL